MCVARRRAGFTLIELLVVMALILAIAALGIGYVVFGQDNQHSFVAAQAVTSALLNAKQRARRDGVPTGVRILFGANSQAAQLVLVQQPDDYTAGQIQANAAASNVVTFNGVDFQGGADFMGEAIDPTTKQPNEATVMAGDYFWLPGTPFPHRINKVAGAVGGPQTLTLDSQVGPVGQGQAYAIIRAPRRLPSEDIISLPPTMVIDDSVLGGITLCQNLPLRTLIDTQSSQNVSEIVFAPSGAVVGQGTQADKILLWLRDPSQKTATGGVPLIVSIQIRTGLIGVYPVAPWNTGLPVAANNDPYRDAKDGRASGM